MVIFLADIWSALHIFSQIIESAIKSAIIHKDVFLFFFF